MTIAVLSKIADNKISAVNVLIEISIKDYLSIAQSIISNNEMQRKKVRSSRSVYSLLRNDLKQGCTIPPIFLAVRKEAMGTPKKLAEILKLSDQEIKSYIEKKQLLILDGLQRTYQLIELEQDLKKSKDLETLKDFYNRKLRAEIFIGINKIGILYRMLTLNTGQTPMSVRHQIEILYQDYLGKDKIKGVELMTEVDGSRGPKLGKYRFNEMVDGFQSYLEKDELSIDRSSMLEDVKSLEKLSKVGQQRDLFQEFVTCFHIFLAQVISLGKNWSLKEDDELLEDIPQPFALDAESIFLRGQVMTGFGAALGSLEDDGQIKSLDSLLRIINKIKLPKPDAAFRQILTDLERIRKTSKKIGNSQRRYFFHLFKTLFNSEGDSHLDLNRSIDKAFKNYKVEFM